MSLFNSISSFIDAHFIDVIKYAIVTVSSSFLILLFVVSPVYSKLYKVYAVWKYKGYQSENYEFYKGSYLIFAFIICLLLYIQIKML